MGSCSRSRFISETSPVIPICDRDETNYELAVEARLPHSPRGTSGERAGERGSQPKRPPLPACVAEANSARRRPDPLLLVGGEGEESRIRFAQSQDLTKHSSQFESDLE